MDFLYFCLDPVNYKPKEFKKNIAGKVSGVKRLGYKSDYIYYNQKELVYVVKDETKHFSIQHGNNEVNDYICDTVCSILKKNSYDFLYLNGSLLNSKVIKIARFAKERKFSVKVIFEPEYYPIDNMCYESLDECKNGKGILSYRRKLFSYKKCLARLPKAVDTAAVMEIPCMETCGIPAISAYNGIDVSSVEFCRGLENTGDPISVLGVVDNKKICGYGRILKGFEEYGKFSKQQKYSFDIVGKDADTEELKKMTEEFNIEKHINFLGEKTYGEIAKLCGTHTVAISNLGLYSDNMVYSSPKITKLYCAAGIPFIYAYEDISLDSSVPFTLKVANNNSPVSMDVLQGFVLRCRLDSRLAKAERKFAEDHYNWWVIMKRILEFTATGRREA